MSIAYDSNQYLFIIKDLNGEANEAAQLIDRYKVLDLWPCGKNELVIFGLNDSEEKTTVNNTTDGVQPAHFSNEKSKKTINLVAPDVSQLTPFKVIYYLKIEYKGVIIQLSWQ